jgi:hypothetical protein
LLCLNFKPKYTSRQCKLHVGIHILIDSAGLRLLGKKLAENDAADNLY